MNLCKFDTVRQVLATFVVKSEHAEEEVNNLGNFIRYNSIKYKQVNKTAIIQINIAFL